MSDGGTWKCSLLDWFRTVPWYYPASAFNPKCLFSDCSSSSNVKLCFVTNAVSAFLGRGSGWILMQRRRYWAVPFQGWCVIRYFFIFPATLSNHKFFFSGVAMSTIHTTMAPASARTDLPGSDYWSNKDQMETTSLSLLMVPPRCFTVHCFTLL